MISEVIIIGAGGHAAEVDEYISNFKESENIQKFKVVGFLDDNRENYERYNFSAPLLGGIANHKIISGQFYIIGIANLIYRRRIVDRFELQGGFFQSFIHNSAFVSKSADIGRGSIIGPNVNIGPNVKIGDFTLVNSRCSLGHDTIVGDYNFISPNVCFSGFTEVGDENLFGINSATLPNIKVGSNNKIAAGMILDKNIGNDSVVFHRFKEKVIAVPKK